MEKPPYPPQGHVAEYIIFADLGLLDYGAVATAASRQRARGTGIVQGTVLLRRRPVQWKLRFVGDEAGAPLPDPARDPLPPEPVTAPRKVVAAPSASPKRPAEATKAPTLAARIGALNTAARTMLNRGLAAYGLQLVATQKPKVPKKGTSKPKPTTKPAAKRKKPKK